MVGMEEESRQPGMIDKNTAITGRVLLHVFWRLVEIFEKDSPGFPLVLEVVVFHEHYMIVNHPKYPVHVLRIR